MEGFPALPGPPSAVPHVVVIFFMINIDNSVQFGKDPGRKFASFVFPFDTQRGEAALSL